MSILAFALSIAPFAIFVLAVGAIRSAIRRFRGTPPPNSPRARQVAINLEAERVLRGVVPASVVASFLFPTSHLMAAFAYSSFVDWHPAALGTDMLRQAVLVIITVGGLFLLFAIFWGLGIALVLPIWKFLYRRGARGPFAAATLGAFASAAVASAIPPLEIFAFFISTKLAVISMAAAGAIGGTVIWWTAYRPELVRERLRRCPMRNAIS